MKRALLAIMLVTGIPAAAQAQQRSAFLLGTTKDNGTSNMFTTFLITREGDQVRVVAKAPRLLVPRKDGFWWLDAWSGYSGYGMDGPSGDDGAVCDTTTHEQPTGEAEEEPEGSASVLRLTRVGSIRSDSVVLNAGSLTVHAVGNDWISLSETTTDRTEHSYTSQYIMPFRSITDTTSYDQNAAIIPDNPLMQKALAQCEKELRKDWQRLTGSDEIHTSSDWIVLRRQTNWSLEVNLANQMIEANEELGGCEMPRAATASFIGFDRVAVPWHVIKDAMPGATTAFESPAHDLLLVLQNKTLYAFIPAAGKLGRVVARIVIEGRPVMSQWAVDTHAARWADEVTTLFAGAQQR